MIESLLHNKPREAFKSDQQFLASCQHDLQIMIHNLELASTNVTRFFKIQNSRYNKAFRESKAQQQRYQNAIAEAENEINKHWRIFKSDAEGYLLQLQDNITQLKAREETYLSTAKEIKIKEEELMKAVQIEEQFRARYNTLQTHLASLSQKVVNVRLVKQRKQEELKEKEAHYASISEELETYFFLKKKLNNELQERKGNVRVYCRIRPLSSLQTEEKQKFYEVVNDTSLLMKVPKESLKSENHRKQFYYNFEMIFDNAKQIDVFNELAQLVQSCLDGKNVCIFAYGQTGSGKTYTMEGGEGEHRGVIPRSVEYIFSQIQRSKNYGWSHEIFVSVQEVYMENVRDLLMSNESGGEIQVQTPQEIQHLLDVAKSNRKVAETECNSHSSRSHSIFTLKIRGRNEKEKDKLKEGSLNLIDLAGSERISQSKVQGQRLKQTMSINKSLTQLSSVITSLAKKEQHIPYRNSKLTYLLQPYLSGDSKTLMMVNISPLVENYQQTICSLRFAETVRECIIQKN